MHDPVFLRKRTAELLRVTSEEFLADNMDNEGNINNNNSQMAVGRRMKADRRKLRFGRGYPEQKGTQLLLGQRAARRVVIEPARIVVS